MNNGRIKIVGVGAGGHASVILDLIESLPGAPYEVVGLLDSDQRRHGSLFHGSSILGGDALLPELRRNGVVGCFLGLGSIGRTEARRRLYALAEESGLEIVPLVHPTAIIAKSAVLGRGCCIMAGAIVNPGATIGRNVCVNTGAIIEHDCRIDDHAFIAPGVVLAGGVRVGAGAFVGLRAGVKQGCVLGEESLIAGGAMVVRDVAPRAVVGGVPARVIRER
ncbi:MAG: acetyltransferase [Nibricoccus sp.]